MSHLRRRRPVAGRASSASRLIAMLVVGVGILSFGSVGSAASISLVINEIDYDQPGTDAAEFLELKNVSGGAINLDAYSVELLNGSSAGAVYRTFDLPAASLAAGDYYVVCANAANVANCDLVITPPTDLIQNGAPDAARVVLTGTTIDAVSYEGDTTGGTEGSGVGLTDTAAGAESISRCADGVDTDQNNVDFSLRAISPGAANACATPKVVINEIDYDQPGTDTAEFFELKNVGSQAVSLGGYSVELVNGSGGTVYQTIALPAVSLAGGDYFVVCANTATTSNCDLDVAPDSNLIQNGDPDGLRLLLAGSVVDAVSYEGDTAGATEGSGVGLSDPAVAANEGISRCPDGADTEQNNVDLSLRATSPGAANSCAPPKLVVNEIDYDQPSTDTAEFLELKNVSAQAIGLGAYSVELVNGNAGGAVLYQTIPLPSVTLAAGDYFVVCANATNTVNCDLDVTPETNLIQNGSPDAVAVRQGATLVDTVSYAGNTGAPYTEGSGEGLVDSPGTPGAGLSRCDDGADTNQNNVDLGLRSITPGATNACPPPPPSTPFGVCGDGNETRIHAVQGTGTATPVAGSIRVIEGVVVGDYQADGQFNGFYVQEETAHADTDPLTSEGIFVFNGAGGGPLDVKTGDLVRVRGTADESVDLTQLSSVTDVVKCPTSAAVPPTGVSLPVEHVADLERYEGMLVRFDQRLTATDVFNLGRFGEISLAVDRLRNPTAVASPGAPAQAVADLNSRSRIVLDDGDNTQNRDPTIYPAGGLTGTNTLRVGDSLASLDGVMDQRFGAYRIQPIGALDFIASNPRPAAPDAVGGNLKVASFNVLNYFNDFGCGDRCRGADTQFEFDRQEAKIVSALKAIDADIVGLMEIENDGGPQSALGELVAALNDATAAGTYAFVDTGVIGTDAIKVALIYKPARVSPVGAWDILTTADDPRFIDTRNRPTLVQTFSHTSSGQVLTVAVNHLKSKGSACGGAPDDQPDTGGGNCNGTRTAAAAALADWLNADPTGSGDPDRLIIGDLNSYTFETPIQELEARGFANMLRAFHGLAPYSYVFNGESGYLDHALATSSLAEQITGVTDWHINPDEPTALDYNTDFKTENQIITFYDPGPYRASDHDPVVIGIQFNHAPTADAGGPYSVAEGSSVAVSASGADPDEDTLSYAWDLDNDGDFDDATGQSASFSAATIDGPDARTIRVRVSDSEASTVDEATVDVTNVAPTATFNAPATVFAGFPIALSLTGASDPAPADVLSFAFDCGDGNGFGPFGASATASCPTTATGTRTVGGNVRDDDGGETPYTATVQVIVSFDSLCDLTKLYVDSADVAQSLCDKLAAAKAAAAAGKTKTKENILDAYVNQVEAQSGKSMTAAEAEILTDLAEQL